VYRWGFNLYENPALPGDYNGDGTVDAADYVVWRKTLGTTGLGQEKEESISLVPRTGWAA
jgi:hypothetical protein